MIASLADAKEISLADLSELDFVFALKEEQRRGLCVCPAPAAGGETNERQEAGMEPRRVSGKQRRGVIGVCVKLGSSVGDERAGRLLRSRC